MTEICLNLVGEIMPRTQQKAVKPSVQTFMFRMIWIKDHGFEKIQMEILLKSKKNRIIILIHQWTRWLEIA